MKIEISPLELFQLLDKFTVRSPTADHGQHDNSDDDEASPTPSTQVTVDPDPAQPEQPTLEAARLYIQSKTGTDCPLVDFQQDPITTLVTDAEPGEILVAHDNTTPTGFTGWYKKNQKVWVNLDTWATCSERDLARWDKGVLVPGEVHAWKPKNG